MTLWPEVQKVVVEIGFDDDTVQILGDSWLEFGKAWVVAESALCRSGKKAVISSMGPDIPQSLIDWIAKKRRKEDTRNVEFNLKGIKEGMLKWWKGMGELLLGDANTVIEKEWCS